MRIAIIALSFVLSVLLFAGCSRPWVHPDYPDRKQADFRFDKDSTDCGIVASEQYPLSKNQQLPIYESCMEDKGWVKRQGDGIPLKKKK